MLFCRYQSVNSSYAFHIKPKYYKIDFYNAILPHMERFVKITEQSVHLLINDQGEALYLNKVEAPGSIITQPSKMGLRFPIYCTAVGKVLLNYMDEPPVDKIITEKGMKKITKNTISDKRHVRLAVYRWMGKILSIAILVPVCTTVSNGFSTFDEYLHLKTLSNQNWIIRRSAAMVLSKIGSGATEALLTLKKPRPDRERL